MNDSIAVHYCYVRVDAELAIETIVQPMMVNCMYGRSKAPNTVVPNERYTFEDIR